MLLTLLIAVASAACPGEPVGADALPGLPLLGPLLATPDADLRLPGTTRLAVPVSAPARAEVVFSAPCLPVQRSGEGEDRVLRIGRESDLFSGLLALDENQAIGTLNISLGDQRAALAVSAVTLHASDGGWSTTLRVARPRPAPYQGDALDITWLANGRVFDESGSGGDAWLLAALGLLTPPPDRLSEADRLALYRLWATNPLLLPFDTVSALQGRTFSARDRAALGSLLYPPGDRRYAGATVRVPGEARLLANGREVPGEATQAPLAEGERAVPMTVFVLPVGGPLSLRVEDAHGVHEHRVVVDASSRVALAAFMAMGAMPVGERRYQTEGPAHFTFCEGRALENGICPRWSANSPSQLHATASLGAEQRFIQFMPFALGTYTIVWQDADLGLRWAPLP